MKTTLTNSNAKPAAKTILMAGLTLMMTAACSGGKHSNAKGSDLKFESVEPLVAEGYYVSSQADADSKPLLLVVKKDPASSWIKSYAATSVKCGSHVDSSFHVGGSVLPMLSSGVTEVPVGKTQFSDCAYEISAKPMDRESQALTATVKSKETGKDEVVETVTLARVDEASFLAVLKMMKAQYPDFQAKDEACEGVFGKKCVELFQSEPVAPVEETPAQ